MVWRFTWNVVLVLPEQSSIERDALESCLSELPEKQRNLVTLAHTQGVKVKQLAEEAGSTAEAFYMRVNRLRRTLMKCIERKTLAEQTA